MKKLFKEYHQFSADEFQQLFKNCLFVFDTNALLNMYRYSRETVDEYLKVLRELKSKNQLWIPYQVGYEFFENRIGVISEYEKSYDEILSILDDAKKSIETRYKNHPFLDLVKIKEDMNLGLSNIESKIKIQKNNHPKWLEGDDVLENIVELFEDNVGSEYTNEELDKIKKEGQERYMRKIPPGFKDDQKSEEKKYGDLILWFQIIDKAKKSKRSIVLISGDIKDDWWLKKEGRRIMPLPQLKKEMIAEAGVEFHIYTTDNFLELYKIPSEEIDIKAIKEVREIRKSEEERVRRRMKASKINTELNLAMTGRFFVEAVYMFEILYDLIMSANDSMVSSVTKVELRNLFENIRGLRNRIIHGEVDELSMKYSCEWIKDLLFVFNELVDSFEGDVEIHSKMRSYIEKLEKLNLKFSRYIQ
ncbi:MAG: hypothetical protein UR60_C0047G0006 [Candidatus Moranbacteria bacterium GW2011_GWF2_34_56]|nr:MAG: hypothetical protein UR51_C0009G0014 [Candidatus Moranbacteria bacterium GW2011_GWF1_34_10]KKP63266.1 MAG: hypothetical protein UR60_C0047G0006 [Candidatus Moranbacteria bacterium GW2011_GWF2_34_56]HBI17564.1 hypothetical protein [Candidatus Moranbacteria bacterium]